MKVAAIQIESKLDPAYNLRVIRGYMAQAREQGVKAVFLPEVFYSISDGLVKTPYLVEDGNEHWREIQKLAEMCHAELAQLPSLRSSQWSAFCGIVVVREINDVASIPAGCSRCDGTGFADHDSEVLILR